MPKMNTGPKVVLIALAVGSLLYGAKAALQNGWIPTPGIMKALIPTKAVLPELKDALVTNVDPLPLPSDAATVVPQTLVRIEVWEWNAQANLIYANGGASTTRGSLMEKHAVNLQLIRQDSTGQMQTDLIACAKELHDGAAQCSNGANYVVIMGDGAGQFLAGINPQLKKLGPEYQAKVIGATGYSRGEDAFMAPAEVKRNPQAARGLLVAGVLRDGDWNIAQKWEGDNAIPNNPDEKTYDPDAVNWVNADDYLKAAEAYNAGQCEDRKIVKNGHLTGEQKHACVNAVVTWTPGDVNIAKGKGGLVKVVSSKQYRSQMPAVILGPSTFSNKNHDEITGMLAATFEAGDQLKAYDKALHKASAISARLYADQDEAYWYKYFKGVTETDSQGLKVELGGSAVNNLADEKILFGLQPGSNDNFRSSYTTFSNIVMQQYPLMFRDTPIPTAAEIEDRSYITAAEAVMNGAGAEADVPTYSTEATGRTVSKRGYSINFNSNQSTFTPDGDNVMKKLRDDIAITGLAVRIDGYTDNQGDDAINIPLSRARANAVKAWLQRHAPNNFPNSRFIGIEGHGSADPVASNSTSEGRAANRRTDITLVGQ
jgi:outer membrane protein OmpA-like peptidoglycan-associated protein